MAEANVNVVQDLQPWFWQLKGFLDSQASQVDDLQDQIRSLQLIGFLTSMTVIVLAVTLMFPKDRNG